MPKYRVGDHVTWNSEAGFVSGRIVKVHERDFSFEGYTHYASSQEPQYEIRSDKTDHIAAHKESALSRRLTVSCYSSGHRIVRWTSFFSSSRAFPLD